MHPCMLSLFLAGLFSAGSAVAAVSFSASATNQGRPVAASLLEFVPGSPRSRARSNLTIPDLFWKRDAGDPGDADDTAYTANWCGATTLAGSSGDLISSVTGYFTVPNLTLRDGIPAPQYAAAWIGIDGTTCNSALLQAGVTTVVNSNGEQSASAWWEWLPDSSYTISSLPGSSPKTEAVARIAQNVTDILSAEPGDWLLVEISAIDFNNGQILIRNVNQDYNMTLTINNGPSLCLVDADWILEDFSASGELVTLANFDTLWFEGCSATTTSGVAAGISETTTMIDLGNYTNPLCTATTYDDSIFYLLSSTTDSS